MKRKADKIIIIIFIIGAVFFLYPVVANIINTRFQKTTVKQYGVSVEQMNKDKIDEEIKKAYDYNKTVINNTVINNTISDPFSSKTTESKGYDELLDVDGIMASIIIPSIKVNLPVFHGTSELVLSKGAGHMSSTSLPVGGESTHAVLSGHRGLSSAKLFTDLDKVKIGDMFYIKVLDRTLAYKVDQIKVVKPEDTRDLMVVKGKDYVTLVTCTPYGINSHRLLVRGARVSDEKAQTAALTENKKADNTIMYIVLSAAVILIIFFVIIIKKKRRKSAKSVN